MSKSVPVCPKCEVNPREIVEQGDTGQGKWWTFAALCTECLAGDSAEANLDCIDFTNPADAEHEAAQRPAAVVEKLVHPFGTVYRVSSL